MSIMCFDHILPITLFIPLPLPLNSILNNSSLSAFMGFCLLACLFFGDALSLVMIACMNMGYLLEHKQLTSSYTTDGRQLFLPQQSLTDVSPGRMGTHEPLPHPWCSVHGLNLVQVTRASVNSLVHCHHRKTSLANTTLLSLTPTFFLSFLLECSLSLGWSDTDV